MHATTKCILFINSRNPHHRNKPKQSEEEKEADRLDDDGDQRRSNIKESVDDNDDNEAAGGASNNREQEDDQDNEPAIPRDDDDQDEDDYGDRAAADEEQGGGEDEEEEPPTPRQAANTMSNEDTIDDVGDIARASGVQALGMNGSHADNNANGKSATDNINDGEVVSDEEEFIGDDNPIATRVVGGERNGGGGGGFWGQNNRSSGDLVGPSAAIEANRGAAANPAIISTSRAASPMDNLSDISSQLPVTVPLVRSKSRSEFSTGGPSTGVASKAAQGSTFWKARRVLFYKNGDPFFPGVEYRFKPGRDVISIEALLDKISPRLDLPRGARFIFSMDGDRKYSLDELEDGSSYVVSSFKTFKVKILSYLHIFHIRTALPQFTGIINPI